VSKGGDAIYSLLRRSMDDMQGNLTDVRENVKKWVQPPDMDALELSRIVHHSVERVMKVMDMPTRGDLEALNKNLERLSSALERFVTQLDAEQAERTETQRD
jgi:hypothetical protein